MNLSRERLVEAALELIHERGLDALSMRAVADRLDVKAASLYWHVRDREELVELVADDILESVGKPRAGSDWRVAATSAGAALRRVIGRHKDAARVLLEVPGALERSALYLGLVARLETAGLTPADARGVALMLMTYVIATSMPAHEGAPPRPDVPATIAIDSGSRGVVVRAGPAGMRTLIRVPTDQAAAAPAVVHGESVVVRRLRGVGYGVIELNPRRPWRFKIQAPTWKTVLELADVDVREIHVDSGAAKVECFLGVPRGVVPIRVSGGVAGIDLHRPTGAAVSAHVSGGAVNVRLDGFSTRVTVADMHWHSDGTPAAPDRYELFVAGGAVKVSLDAYTPKAAVPDASRDESDSGEAAGALEILFDGVAARIAGESRA